MSKDFEDLKKGKTWLKEYMEIISKIDNMLKKA